MHKLLLLHGYVHKEHIAIEFCAFRGLIFLPNSPIADQSVMVVPDF